VPLGIEMVEYEGLRFVTSWRGILSLKSDGMSSTAGASHVREIIHRTGGLS
jgi:hypothetical protein